ncbi:tyrosine-type recombinase/integrase [Bacillus cereus]|uniref:tyrosine-type recombinase/integrase n=1 Tax=Bacillus cereus TaxID=1396 RepID=UPI0009B58F9C
MKKYSIAYGRPLTVHNLRYSFGIRYFTKHKNLKKSQQIMGHSDIITTRIYKFI